MEDQDNRVEEERKKGSGVNKTLHRLEEEEVQMKEEEEFEEY